MEEAAFHYVLRGALLTWEQRNKDSSGWADLSQISSTPEHLLPYDSPPGAGPWPGAVSLVEPAAAGRAMPAPLCCCPGLPGTSDTVLVVW